MSSDDEHPLPEPLTNEKRAELLEMIKRERKKNFGPDLLEKSQTADSFISTVQFKIAVDSIYEISDYVLNDMDQKILPVLLYIKDETILRKETRLPKGSPITDGCFRYIIEVWRNDGELLYERNLRHPPLGWSCSDNMFFYYEDDN